MRQEFDCRDTYDATGSLGAPHALKAQAARGFASPPNGWSRKRRGVCQPLQLRLSLDYRYQPVSEPVHEESLLPHVQVLGWDEVYQDWPNDAFRYYWLKQDLSTTTVRSFDQYPQLRPPV